MKPEKELKTYTPPKLTQFGSVKDLTSSGTDGGKENGGGMMGMGMGMGNPMGMP